MSLSNEIIEQVVALAKEFAKTDFVKMHIDQVIRHVNYNKRQFMRDVRDVHKREGAEDEFPEFRNGDRKVVKGVGIADDIKSEKRSAKADNIFLANDNFAKTRIVASATFLKELAIGHLMYDGRTNHLKSRYTVTGTNGKKRWPGVVVAELEVDKDAAPPSWIWRQCKRMDIVSELSKVCPNADAAFAVLRYCMPHADLIRSLVALDDNEFAKRRFLSAKEDNLLCHKCKIEAVVACSDKFERQQAASATDEERVRFCMNCSRTENRGACLLPLETKLRLSVIVEQLGAFEKSPFRSNKVGDSEWEVRLLDQFRPSKMTMDVSESFTAASVERDLKKCYVKQAVTMRKTVYELQNLQRKLSVMEDQSTIGRTIAAMREKFAPDEERIHHPCLVPSASEGILMDFNRKNERPGTLFHFDPTMALNVAVNPVESCGAVVACWALVPPSRTPESIAWLKSKGLLEELLDRQLMEEMRDELGGEPPIHIVEQKHGDVVEIPVGWGHLVRNEQQCVKLAFDYIKIGALHRCVLSHIHCWLKLIDEGSSLTDSYVNFLTIALDVLPFESHLDKKRKVHEV